MQAKVYGNPALQAEIEKVIRPEANEQREMLVARFDEEAKAIDQTIAALSAKAGDIKVVSALTDTVAVEDPSLKATVKRNTASGRKTPIIYGGVYKDIRNIQKLVEEKGCSLDEVILLDRRDKGGKILDHDSLIAKIRQAMPGIEEACIGIRSAEGEIEGNVTKGKQLAIKREVIDGKNVLLTMNSEKVLLSILLAGADAGKLRIPGLYYDDVRKIFIFAPIVPEDYGKVMAKYRSAMLALSTAA
jgi:hypothetical protein